MPAAGTELRDDLLTGIVQPLGATIARVRGRITWTPGSYAAGQAAVAGICVDSSVQPIADQGPVFDPDKDWMMYEPFFYQPPVLGTGAVTDLQWQPNALHREIDVRSMRRLPEASSTLWLYVEARGASVASAITYDLSVLLMLP